MFAFIGPAMDLAVLQNFHPVRIECGLLKVADAKYCVVEVDPKHGIIRNNLPNFIAKYNGHTAINLHINPVVLNTFPVVIHDGIANPIKDQLIADRLEKPASYSCWESQSPRKK